MFVTRRLREYNVAPDMDIADISHIGATLEMRGICSSTLSASKKAGGLTPRQASELRQLLVTIGKTFAIHSELTER